MEETKPKKKKTLRDILYKIIVLLLIAIILVSGYNVATTLLRYKSERDSYTQIAEIALVNPLQFTGEVDWDALHEINENVVGWIYLKDTLINYPVGKYTDNDWFLHRLIDGSYAFAGTIFVDCNAKDIFESFNTVIYGHHMKDDSMFGDLDRYFNEEDFYENHKNVEFVTPTEKYHIQIFTGFTTDASSDIYIADFATDEEKQAHIDMLKAYNQIHTDDIEVTTDDHLVTLSTCVYSEGEARYVLIGKLVPWTDEEKEEALAIQATLD